MIAQPTGVAERSVVFVKGTMRGRAWLAALQLATCAPGAAPADNTSTLEVAS